MVRDGTTQIDLPPYRIDSLSRAQKERVPKSESLPTLLPQSLPHNTDTALPKQGASLFDVAAVTRVFRLKVVICWQATER
ncbi:MAG: hypothetical protein LBQ66_06020 [Planctomycetaceae bacterium]|nr:hypothetical protein [Planctomycetaceae bacterium]